MLNLQFKSNDGEVIKTYSSKDDKNELTKLTLVVIALFGTHVTNGAEKLDGMIFWSASFSGAKAVPGSYSVSLMVNGKEQTQRL